jgi:SPP1 family predicted phage head-tail adaptor
MEGLTGNERFEAEREHGEVDHRWRLRYLDGVTTKMRVNYDSRVFDIEARFDPTGKGEELVLLTNEKEA